MDLCIVIDLEEHAVLSDLGAAVFLDNNNNTQCVAQLTRSKISRAGSSIPGA